jgi:hypothetical protein
MPTYNVTYSRIDYFEKEYEADSYEDAEDMFYDDPDKYTYNPPYSSQDEFVNITEVS